MPQNDGLEQVKNGQIAATLFVAGRPATAVARLGKDAGFKLLPVPYTRELENDYLPAQFSSTDYPNLVEAGQRVETIAVGAVLASFNWERTNERYRKTAAFTDALFKLCGRVPQRAAASEAGRVNFAATLPGWTRFPAAEEWLAANRRGGE